MDNMNNVIGEVGFRFSSRFSQLIGRNLISNPVVAVSELVKNSYDADADNISVEFSNLLSGVPTLKITDDGDGMTFDDIATKWMMVGTDNKVHNPLTPKGRRKLGEKGIGRFSVERLARKLQIISSKSDDDFAISLSIDWDQYENYEGEFSALTHRVVKLPCDICHKGTTLILSELRDEWTETRLLDLQKEIELLRPLDINRLSFKKYSFPGDNVKIALSAPGILKKKTFINSNFIDYAQAHLYINLLTSDKLNSYLADINEQAESVFSRLIKQMVEREGVTEQLKSENQLLWIQKMNNIRNRANEIVSYELIHRT